MAYGIKVINDSGVLTISEDYSNFSFLYKQTFSNGQIPTPIESVAPSYMLQDGIMKPEYPWMRFVRPAGISGGGHSVWSQFNDAGATYYSSSGAVDMVYAVIGQQKSSGYGLHVLRPDGSIAFDSNRRVICPVHQFNANTAGTSPGSTVSSTTGIALPAGKERYISCTSLSRYAGHRVAVDMIAFPFAWYEPKFKFNSPTSFSVTGYWNYNPSSAPSNYNEVMYGYCNFDMLLIDL